MSVFHQVSAFDYRGQDPGYARHRTKFGGYNASPPNLQPCEPERFWRQFSMYGLGNLQELRQFVLPDKIVPYPMNYSNPECPKNKPMVTAQLFFYHGDVGYAIVVDHRTGEKYEPQFYRFFLCDHEMQEVNVRLGNCLHRYKCSKCEYTYDVDSSG